MVHAWMDYLTLFAVGAVAGTLNVIAGGGSFLTLPAMIFLGLPPTVANGTNRVAILAQNAGAVWSFSRHRLVDWRWMKTAAVPAVAGALGGTWAAVQIGDAAFQRILAVLMAGVALWSLWNPAGGREAGSKLDTSTSASRAGLAVGFFLAGAYGGFVQAGVGFLILAVCSMGGLDLVRGNAMKVLLVLVFTPFALLLFALNDQVVWDLGLALGAGNVAGALLGVRLTVLKGHAWVRRVVTAALVVFAVKLWLGA